MLELDRIASKKIHYSGFRKQTYPLCYDTPDEAIHKLILVPQVRGPEVSANAVAIGGQPAVPWQRYENSHTIGIDIRIIDAIDPI
jgi:hypothetical protein